MSENILIALINFLGLIVAAIIGALGTIFTQNIIKANKYKGIYYLEKGENFNELLSTTEKICMYTVNSFQLCNSINMLLEQDNTINIQQIIILVRKKENETPEDIEILNNINSIWIDWVKKGRIRKLLILGYDHDPDHYYTILGDRVVFTGHVFFDNTRPTGTNINYSPLVFFNDTDLGKKVIKKYQQHFDHLVDKYKTNVLYCSNN